MRICDEVPATNPRIGHVVMAERIDARLSKRHSQRSVGSITGCRRSSRPAADANDPMQTLLCYVQGALQIALWIEKNCDEL
jgi:hypothetical protein